MQVNPKIIIIGGGASGIAAATRLLENGITDVTVLEAENRIGGRIHSVDFGGSIVDLGAQWCHGEQDNIVYELVKDLDFLSTSFNNYYDNTFYLSNGTVLDKVTTDNLFKIALEIFEDEETALTYKGTFGDYFMKKYDEMVIKRFGNNNEVKKVANLMLDWFHKFFLCLEAAKSWFEISTVGPYRFKHCEGDFQLQWRNKGYRTILYVLMKQIPDVTKQLKIDDKIFLNKHVTRIVWDDNIVNKGGVTIDCSDGSSYNADHVIVTVSLGVLKSSYKTLFVPELPQFKQNVIEGMSIGTTNKILLKFPIKWWPNDLKGFCLTWTEDDRINIRNEFSEGPVRNGRSWLEDIFGFYVIDSHPSILLGWVVGEMADEIELLSDQTVIDGCMYLLRKFASQKYNVQNPDDILRSKWKTNPHFQGSYTFTSIEAEKRKAFPEDLEKPLISSSSKQSVMFAGEATHPKYFSTVHGAIETGFREANRILNIYKSPTEKYHRIVILGAGMAGLGAAQSLVDFGCKDLLILEAENKAGGRVNTFKWRNHVINMGAQWIHGKMNPLYEIAKEHNLISDIQSEEGTGVYIRENGDIISDDVVKEVNFQIGKILNECERFVDCNENYPSSVGDFMKERFLDYLKKSDDSKQLTKVKLELYNWHELFQIIDNSCIDLYKLSAKEWGKYICVDDMAHFNLKFGYKSLLDVLIKKLPPDIISLSTEVSSVEYDKELIRLKCQNNKVILCDHLIITASLGVLKSNQIKFSPSLPQPIIDSIEDMGFHGIGKIFLIFNHKWWKEEGFQFIWDENTVLSEEENWTRYITGFDSIYNEPNVLLGWIGGHGVYTMESLDEEQVRQHCIKLLRKFIRNYTIPDPIKVIRTTWSSNPWIRGAYSYTTPKCDQSGNGISKLLQPICVDSKIKILFAGEAVHSCHFSTTHGAYESGQNQACLLYKHISRLKL